MIFLGVKPAQFSELLSQYQTILEKRESLLLISMAAGLTLEKLASLIPSQHRIIRMMPNTPASIGQGVISYALSSNCSAEDSELFCQLLANAGLLVELGEGLIDAATGPCRLWASLCLSLLLRPWQMQVFRLDCHEKRP